ncbi:MAG: ribbon-helix-helix protein, CopG family [Akkermansiaceae bacterium]|nr:ribbon-helix-helix protein, CopG family [Akkermansiaceae bacterium]
MIAVRLDKETENRLAKLAKQTGRTKSYYLREALHEYLQDMEDYYLGMGILKEGGRLYTAAEAKRELGLND